MLTQKQFEDAMREVMFRRYAKEIEARLIRETPTRWVGIKLKEKV